MEYFQVTYFCIVKFKCNKTISGIPKSWITNTDANNAICYWPRVCNKQQVLKCAPPSHSWPKYEIKVMKQFETYEAAESELLTTENTKSEFEVEKKTYGKRKQKQNKRYTDFHIGTPPSLQSLSSSGSKESDIIFQYLFNLVIEHINLMFYDLVQFSLAYANIVKFLIIHNRQNHMEIFLQEAADNLTIMEGSNNHHANIAATPIVIAESPQYVNSFEQSVINHLLEIKATQQTHYNTIMVRLNRMGLSNSNIGPANYDLLPPLPCTTLIDQEFEKLL
ncbi:hypothetical protein RN001_005589 [Aquatica leii]|uniref:Uncharacterized protein n=1 Tax=Aquatica leii TaxID=1421715 RepID=A0AAN7SS34_9COLE|nr:hypothetical protein RN001_005589 [Aquatica leii]